MGKNTQFLKHEFSSVRGVIWCGAISGVTLGLMAYAAGPATEYVVPIACGLWSTLLAILVWRVASRRAVLRFGSTEVFDALPSAVVVIDRHLDIVACNAASARLFGKSETSLIGESLDLILRATHELQALISQHDTRNGKIRMTGVVAENKTPELEVSWSSYEQAGEPRILLMLSDISSQMRRQQIYQFLLEGTTLSLGKTFFPSLCRRMSEAFRVPVAFIGKFEGAGAERLSLLSLCRNGRLQHSADPMQMDLPWRTLMPGSHYLAASGFSDKVENSQWLENQTLESCLAVAIRDEQGETIGVLGMMDDQPWENAIDDAAILSIFAARAALEFSESERYDEIATASQEAGQATHNAATLLHSVSHEIRTLLTSIMGFANYLESAGGDERQRQLAVDAIKRSGNQLMTVVESAQLAAGDEVENAESPNESCSPQEILAKTAAVFRSVAEEKGISLTPYVDDSAPDILETNPDAVHRVLLSMLEFAAARSPVGGRIDLTVELEQNNVEFSVSDWGERLSVEQLGSLFKSCPIHACGADLPEAQYQARVLGGVIDAETREDGITLHLNIPLASDDQLTVKLPSRFLAGKRMLLVEDGPDNRQLLKFLLEDEGAEVAMAENGKEGVDMAMSAEAMAKPFDMILMDMQMPVMDGHEATRRLRTSHYPRPIVAVTANAQSIDRERAMLAGCDEYVSKPVDRDELMVRIHLCLEEYRETSPVST